MASSLVVERDTEILIDTQLKNLGWDNQPHSASRNVYQQRPKTEAQKRALSSKRPDYILYATGSTEPLGIIEAKKPGQNIHEALVQGLRYAEVLEAPLVFATDGVFTKTVHSVVNRPLRLNGEEVDELVRETLALRFLQTNEVATLDKKVIRSRGELISIFGTVNDLLREEGLQKGLERFTEFSNILFLKVLSEIEDGKEEQGEKSAIDPAFRWRYFRDKKGKELLSYLNDTVLRWFAHEYKDDNIFQRLQIQHPENLRQIIRLLDDLQLTDINADVKGDAFEYFIRSYSASNPSDLGEIFTPRHIVKTLVKLVNPQIGEKVYDPFCGTGGMLIVAFKHILANMPTTFRLLKRETIFGADLTKSASIAKMNMILAGDGHNNIGRRDSLRYPVDDEFDVLLSNMPFSQKTRYGDKYSIPSRNGDIICPQHCFRSLREGGRMGLIVPDGFLSNVNNGAYEDVRKFLLNNAVLKSIVSLPRGAFEPYNRAKASILYFTDVKKSKTKSHYWFIDVQNDGYTLDKKRAPLEGGNDLELVLSESNLGEQSKDYLLKLGISQIKLDEVESNEYILNAAQYRTAYASNRFKFPVFSFSQLFSLPEQARVGSEIDIPIMSITMAHGLIDQSEKFKKRVASTNITNYKKVARGQLVVGFPIDEGVLGFQLKYPFAAVSPAYTIWSLTEQGHKIDSVFLELLLRSDAMRKEYKLRMQGAVDRRRSIPQDVFLSICVPIPSREVQEEVVKMHRELLAAAEKAKSLERAIHHEMTDLFT